MDKKGDVFGRLHIGRDIDEAEDESGAESEYGKEALHFTIFLSTLNPADITLKPTSRRSRHSSGGRLYNGGEVKYFTLPPSGEIFYIKLGSKTYANIGCLLV